MGLLDFLIRRQQTQNTALTVREKGSIESYREKKKIKDIVDFIENAIISNGGNYEDIYQKLLIIAEFSKSAKEYGVDCNLAGVAETLRDFFIKQADIKYYPVKDKPYTAFYTKKDGWNRYNYRGVTVLQDEGAKRPVMYYGRRNENAETHRQDCIFAFGDDVVILRNESSANYDEIPLYGNGSYAEFYFDENNYITRVKFKYMTHPRLGFWSDEQVCEFDQESGQYRLLPTQIPERKYNDPKPSDKSIKKCASFIVNMFDNTKE